MFGLMVGSFICGWCSDRFHIITVILIKITVVVIMVDGFIRILTDLCTIYQICLLADLAKVSISLKARFGRKIAILGSMLLSTTASLVGAFMPEYWSYLVLRLFFQIYLWLGQNIHISCLDPLHILPLCPVKPTERQND